MYYVRASRSTSRPDPLPPAPQAGVSSGPVATEDALLADLQELFDDDDDGADEMERGPSPWPLLRPCPGIPQGWKQRGGGKPPPLKAHGSK